MTDQKPLLGGVELGGTKCVCLIGTGPDDIRAQASMATGTDPARTLRRIDSLLRGWQAEHGPVRALGVASFGPIDLLRQSPRYGHITSTAKPGWSYTDVLGSLAHGRMPTVGFNTDVNGAALAEQRWGAAQSLGEFAYVTVGTGIGVGLIVGGRPVFGCTHTELGHLRIVRARGDTWPGICAFHGDCVEGLASGPAISARMGMPASTVPADSPVWEVVAQALAQLLQAVVLATSPKRIFIGGGVAEGRPGLLVRVRECLRETLNGYLELDELEGGMDRYIVPPGLGALAGPLGALALAADACGAPACATHSVPPVPSL